LRFALLLRGNSTGSACVQQSSIVDLFSAANRLESAQESQKAADLYKTWIASNPGNQLLHAVYFNYGVALSRLGDRAGAINALRSASG
jgi:tetratricopeptide (TPR) repeat protein